MSKEWSFLCDAFLKVLSSKISNFDYVTTTMLDMLYMLLNDRYFNFDDLILIEIDATLGNKNGTSIISILLDF